MARSSRMTMALALALVVVAAAGSSTGAAAAATVAPDAAPATTTPSLFEALMEPALSLLDGVVARSSLWEMPLLTPPAPLRSSMLLGGWPFFSEGADVADEEEDAAADALALQRQRVLSPIEQSLAEMAAEAAEAFSAAQAAMRAEAATVGARLAAGGLLRGVPRRAAAPFADGGSSSSSTVQESTAVSEDGRRRHSVRVESTPDGSGVMVTEFFETVEGGGEGGREQQPQPPAEFEQAETANALDAALLELEAADDAAAKQQQQRQQQREEQGAPGLALPGAAAAWARRGAKGQQARGVIAPGAPLAVV